MNKNFGSQLINKKDLFTLTYSYDIGREGFQESLDWFAKIIKIDIESNSNDVNLRKKIEYGIKDLNTLFLIEKSKGNQLGSIKNILFSILEFGQVFNPLGREQTFAKSTFTIDMLQKKVIKYYKDNYVGNKMKLAITSGLSIKEIKGIVIKVFFNFQGLYTPIKRSSKVETNNISLPISTMKLGKMVFINYTSKTNYFKISFLFDNIPYSTTLYYFSYLTYLFKDKSKYSLSSLLIDNDLISSLSPFSEYFKEGTFIFTLNFQLPNKGLRNVDFILEQTFNFVRILRKNKPNELIYNDMRSIHYTIFKFREEIENTKAFQKGCLMI